MPDAVGVVHCHVCGVMMLYEKAIQDGGYYCADCYEKQWDDDEDYGYKESGDDNV